jgi:hypothetical protein
MKTARQRILERRRRFLAMTTLLGSSVSACFLADPEPCLSIACKNCNDPGPGSDATCTSEPDVNVPDVTITQDASDAGSDSPSDDASKDADTDDAG